MITAGGTESVLATASEVDPASREPGKNVGRTRDGTEEDEEKSNVSDLDGVRMMSEDVAAGAKDD